MCAEEIRNHIRRQPFQPFRVFVSDGSSYEVAHPDFILVTRREVVIAQELGEGDIPERSAYLDPVHITRIEPFNGQTTRSRKKPRT